MGYFDKLAALNFMVICRRNGLGTTTMFAVTQDELNMDIDWNIDTFLDSLPEWRLVDFVGDDAAKGARLLYEKLTYTGHYAGYDERYKDFIGHEFLIGFDRRPECERYQAVEDAPAPPPELVENLNLSEGGE
jgi:hypothetical protein